MACCGSDMGGCWGRYVGDLITNYSTYLAESTTVRLQNVRTWVCACVGNRHMLSEIL